MNTVAIGDAFENSSYELIRRAIDRDELGISPRYARVFSKKGYYSSLRNKEIVFDLSIEIWPPNAQRYSALYLIECKDYSTKAVPVGDIEEFLYKIRQINNSHHNDARGVKGVFISNSSFQESSVKIAEETGLMIIEVGDNDDFSIILHRTPRTANDNFTSVDKEIETFLFNVFDLSRVSGLRRYSKREIRTISVDLLTTIDEIILKGALRTPLDDVMKYLTEKFNLCFEFDPLAMDSNGKQILGLFDIHKNKIIIDRSVCRTERFAFTLAHEIGHFILHRNLKINQKVYENFEDSEYDFLSNKYLLNNFKNWIEWQANEFASNLVMPDISFYYRLIDIQNKLGISKTGFIYLDDQPVNRRDFRDITNYLTEFFNTTYTSVVYRLESLGLITYDRRTNNYREELRKMYNDLKE